VCDVEPAQTKVVQQDYLTRSHALTSSTKHSLNFSRMLEECQILLSLQKKASERVRGKAGGGTGMQPISL
jgi:hypothetical protein